MKLRDVLNTKNIKSFIEGNLKHFQKEMVGLPQHVEEQIAWRLSLCYNDCVPTGKCKDCGCPTEKKVLVNKSCNNGERFPDMMNEKKWKQYKIDNNIE